MVLVGFALASTACAKPVPPAEMVPARPARIAPVPSASPSRATSCRAEPSTVYGAEPLVFQIEGPPSSSAVDVQLLDTQRQIVARGRAPVPGAFRFSASPSGDFTLQVGSNAVVCTVTVNRELSRATQAER